MIVIRNKIFETNSSSTHSLTFSTEECIDQITEFYNEFRRGFYQEFPDNDINLHFDFDPDIYGGGKLKATIEMYID